MIPKRDAPPDLDELWRRFNHRVTHLFSFRKSRLKGNSGPPSGNGRIRLRVVISALCSLMVAAWLGSGFYIVGLNQVGVVLQFGAYRYIASPGLRWHWPFPFQSHEFVDTATHTVEIGSKQTGGTARSVDALILTQDGGLVDARFALHYRITDPRAFFFNHASVAYFGVIQAGEAGIREIFSTLTLADTLNPERNALSSKLAQKIQEILDARRSGILVTGMAERNTQWPKSVKRALEEAIKVAQERARRKREAISDAQRIQTQTQVEAKQRVDEAELYKAHAISTAQGESERFKQVLAGYLQAPGMMRAHLYLEAMRDIYAHSTKVLVNGKAAQPMFILPLERQPTQDQSSQKTKSTEESVAPSPKKSTHTKEISLDKRSARWSHEAFRNHGQSRARFEE